MMKRCIYIIGMITCVMLNGASAQTPYDAFAPEASRPILELVSNPANDTVLDPALVSPVTDDIRKWSSVDPMVDKYPGISPYAYCGWNPIRYIDPDGREWLTEEDAQQAAKYTQAMENKISKLSSELAKTKSKIKQDVLNQRITTLQEGLAELQEMGEAKDMMFTYLKLPSAKAGYTDFKDANTIVMGVPDGFIPLGIHESSHGYDYWKQGGTYLEHEKIPAEIKAYKRQFSYDRFSLPWSDEHKYPKNFDQITPSWVQNIYLIGNENEKIFPYRNK